jgi:hypothetical protein
MHLDCPPNRSDSPPRPRPAIIASVVLAVEESADNLPEIMARLAPAENPDVEFFVCHTGQASPGVTDLDHLENVVHVRCSPASRIPHLWRDGVLRCRSERVAFLTGHCIPESGWLSAVRSFDFEDDVAAAGGYFAQPEDASGIDWAIYLLRYAGYSLPRHAPQAGNVAADNAIYRRSALLGCADLLCTGFWEPRFHARFAKEGLRLTLTPELIVLHRNRYTSAGFASQRRDHGIEFGSERARNAAIPMRLVLGLAAPGAAPILFGKVLARTARANLMHQVPWSAFGFLAWFILNWTLGEARGTWRVLLGRS